MLVGLPYTHSRLTCGGNSLSFLTWAGADEASSLAQAPIQWVSTQCTRDSFRLVRRGHPKS